MLIIQVAALAIILCILLRITSELGAFAMKNEIKDRWVVIMLIITLI